MSITEQPVTSKARPGRWGYIFPYPVTHTPLELHQCYMAIAALSAAVLVLPPRTVGRQILSTSFLGWSVCQIRYDQTGKTFTQRWVETLSEGYPTLNNVALPTPQAEVARDRIRLEKEVRRLRAMGAEERRRYLERKARGLGPNDMDEDEEDEEDEKDWRARNARRDKEAFEQGSTLWDVVARDFKEAWDQIPKGSGWNKPEDGKKQDEAAEKETEKGGSKGDDKSEKST